MAEDQKAKRLKEFTKGKLQERGIIPSTPTQQAQGNSGLTAEQQNLKDWTKNKLQEKGILPGINQGTQTATTTTTLPGITNFQNLQESNKIQFGSNVKSNIILPGISEPKYPNATLSQATQETGKEGDKRAKNNVKDTRSMNEIIHDEMVSGEYIPLLKQGAKQTLNDVKKFAYRKGIEAVENFANHPYETFLGSSPVLKALGTELDKKRFEDPNVKTQVDKGISNMWKLYYRYEDKINKNFDKWVDQNMNKIITKEYQDSGGIFESIKKGDTNMIKYGLVQGFSTSVVPMIPGIIAGIVTKNPAVTAGIAFASTAPIEDQEAYEESIKEGATRDEADVIGKYAGIINGALETVGEFLQLKGLLKPLKKNITREITKKTTRQIIARGLLERNKGVFGEALTEGTQEFVTNALIKTINENRDIFAGVLDSMIVGGVLGGGGSTLGAGGKVIEDVENNKKIDLATDIEALNYVMQGEERKAQRMQQKEAEQREKIKQKILSRRKANTWGEVEEIDNQNIEESEIQQTGQEIEESQIEDEMIDEVLNEENDMGDSKYQKNGDTVRSSDQQEAEGLRIDSNSNKGKVTITNENASEFSKKLDEIKNELEGLKADTFLERIKNSISGNQKTNYIINKNTDRKYVLRISSHHANAYNARGNKAGTTSIVIKLMEAPKFKKDNKVNLTEFVYDPANMTTEKMQGIIDGIENWIFTGKYTDTRFDSKNESTKKKGENKQSNTGEKHQLKYEEKGYTPGVANKKEKNISGKEGIKQKNTINDETIEQLAEKYGVKVEVIKGMIEILKKGKGGIVIKDGEAYGKYRDQLLTLSEQIKESTAPHELLHAIFDMIDPETKTYLIAQVMKSEGWNAETAEERLADSFSNFFRTGKIEGAPKSTWGRIKIFFKRVRSFINGMNKWRNELNEIFTDIITADGIVDLQSKIDESSRLKKSKERMRKRFMEYRKNAQKIQSNKAPKDWSKKDASYQIADESINRLQGPGRIEKMENLILNEYGITEDPSHVAFIDNEGRWINGNMGGYGNYRDVDHREIAQTAFDDTDIEFNTGTDALIALQAQTGLIRIDYNNGYLSIDTVYNPKWIQEEALNKFEDYDIREVNVDITDPKNGRILDSGVFESVEEATRFINNYFTNSDEKFQKAGDINSSAFKKRFGDSKVVDKDGNPLVVYHGTRYDIKIPNMKKGRRQAYGGGMYFTTNKQGAEHYANEKKNLLSFLRKPRVMEVYLSIQNPIKEGVYKWDNKWMDELKKLGYEVNEEYLSRKNVDIFDKYFHLRMLQDKKKAINFTEDFSKVTGYDGLVAPQSGGEEYWVAFKPSQVKSATDNVGTYDANNDDIRYQKMDDEYAEAVENGNTTRAKAILREYAKEKGYDSSTDYQGSLAFNGSAPSSDGLTKEERVSGNEDIYSQTLGDFASDGLDWWDLGRQLDPNGGLGIARSRASRGVAGGVYDLESINNLRNAVMEYKKGNKDVKIRMYRAIDSDIKEEKFRNGDWITPSKEYAKHHIDLQDWKKGRVISEDVSIEDIRWDGNDINERGFDNEKEYGYKDTPNNRKELEITYDDNGNLIPLSERFNENVEDERYQRVYHGSPADFDKFDSSHMGEGEGAQAHGWGHYVAVDENTGRRYAQLHQGDLYSNIKYKGESSRDMTRRGIDREDVNQVAPSDIMTSIVDGISRGKYDESMEVSDIAKDIINQRIEVYSNSYEKSGDWIKNAETPEEKAEMQRRADRLRDLIKAYKDLDEKNFDRPQRNLYEVEIPDPVKADTPTGSNYLEEDKYYSKAEVKKFLDLMKNIDSGWLKDTKESRIYDLYKNGLDIRGKDLYDMLAYAKGDKEASKFLESLGYDGIHYFGGRDGEAYVIFNDDALEIKNHERYQKADSDQKDNDGRTLSNGQAEYFKDSKVRDDNGNLLRVYHGTKQPEEFTVFDNSKSNGYNSNSSAHIGNRFTDSKKGAENFAGTTWAQGKPRAMEGYLNIKNPKIYETRDVTKEKAKAGENNKKLIKDMEDRLNVLGFNTKLGGYESLTGMPSLRYNDKEFMKMMGYLTSEAMVNDYKGWGGYSKLGDFVNALSKAGISDAQIVNEAKYLHNLYNDYMDSEKKYYSIQSDAYDQYQSDISTYGDNARDAVSEYKQDLIKQGYDGIIIKNTEYDGGEFGGTNTQYVSFNSNQFKNIDNLNPTDNEDIRFQKAGDINSPAFKKRFGDSKIVNEDGSPKIMYHGTPTRFTIFDKSKIGDNTGNYGYSGDGFYFTDSKDYAGSYGNNVMEVYLKVEKPFTFTKENIKKYAKYLAGVEQGHVSLDKDWVLKELKRNDEKSYDFAMKRLDNPDNAWKTTPYPYDMKYDPNNIVDLLRETERDGRGYEFESVNLDYFEGFGEPKYKDDVYYYPSDPAYMMGLGEYSNQEFIDAIRKDGFDGIITFGEVVVFDSNQVKSATDNVGTYDENNDDIRYQRKDSEGNSLSEGQIKYFENSKIRKDGKLLVVYHGTHGDFTIFDRKKIGSKTNNKGIFGEGFYFTSNKKYGDYYAQPQRSKEYQALEGKTKEDIEKMKGKTMKGYLNITNPFYWRSIKTPNAVKKLIETLGLKKNDLERNSTLNNQMRPITDEKKAIRFRNALEKAGYDGIIYEYDGADKDGNKQDEIVAFYSNQFKNIDNKNPTDNPDIRYQKTEYEYDENGNRKWIKFGDNSEFDPNIFGTPTKEEQIEEDKENEKSNPFYNAWMKYNNQNYKDDQLTLGEFVDAVGAWGERKQEEFDKRKNDIAEVENDPKMLELQLKAVKLAEEEGNVGKKFGKNVSKEVRDRQQAEVEKKREDLAKEIYEWMYPGLRFEEATYDDTNSAWNKEAEWEMLGREKIEEKLRYFKKDSNGNWEKKNIKLETPQEQREKIERSGNFDEVIAPSDRVIEWKTPEGQKGRLDKAKDPKQFKKVMEKINSGKTKTKVELKDVTNEVRALERYKENEKAEKERRKKEKQEEYAKKKQEEYKRNVRLKAFQRLVDMQRFEKFTFLTEDEIKQRWGFTDEEWKKITEQQDLGYPPKKRNEKAVSDFNKAVDSEVKFIREGLSRQNNMKKREAEKNLGEIGEIDLDVLLGRDEEKGQKEVEEFERIAEEEKKKSKKEKNKRLEQAREDVTQVEIDKERENSKSEKERVDKIIKSTKSDRTVWGSIKEFASDLITPVSTRIKEISPKIYRELMKYFQNKDILTNQRLKEIDPFLKAMGKIRKENPVRFMDIWVALANRNIGYANGLLQEYGVKVPTKLLDTIYDEAEDVGLNINYLGSYYPLSVSSPKSFLEELMKVDKGDIASEIEKKIQEESVKKGGPLDESEVTAIINSVIAGEEKGPDVNLGNKHLKKRNTEIKRTPKMLEYCDDPISTLIGYVEGMTQSIERAKFLGKSRSGNVHTLADYVYNAKNGLTPEQQDELMELLKSVFNDAGTHPAIQLRRDIATLTTLGSPSSTLTQLSDLSFSIYENGWRETLKATWDIFMKRKAFDLQDMGIINRGEEYTNINSKKNWIQKMIHYVFTHHIFMGGNAFSQFDTFGKSTFIQSTWNKRRKRALKGENGDPQLRKDIMKWTDDEYMTDKIINDLRNGIFSEDVAMVMYMKLGNIQPLTKTQMPKAYLDNPNGRLFYQFKTFGIKQLDYVLQETKGNLKGWKNLSTTEKYLRVAQIANMVFVMTLLGVGADELKDITMRRRSNSLILRWLFDEDVGTEQIWDKTGDNILKLFGLSRYSIMQMNNGNWDKAISDIFLSLPAMRTVDNIASDIHKAFKDDGSINWRNPSAYQAIPVIGKYRYWIYGGGQDKQQEALDKEKKTTTSGGSSRSSRTKRSTRNSRSRRNTR